jgi:hypothetical protein
MASFPALCRIPASILGRAALPPCSSRPLPCRALYRVSAAHITAPPSPSISPVAAARKFKKKREMMRVREKKKTERRKEEFSKKETEEKRIGPRRKKKKKRI